MRTILTLAWLCILVFSLSSLSRAEKTIRLTSGEWKPYISEALDNYGPYSQIVSEAFALQGIKVEYSFYPWKRALHMAKVGSADGLVAGVHTVEREKNFFYSDAPVVAADRVFFHLKNSGFDWEDINDLKDMTIGATLGYYYGDAFEKAEKNSTISVERSPRDIQNIKMLLSGRIDLFPVTKAVGYSLLQSAFGAAKNVSITHHPKPLSITSFYILFSKKDARHQHNAKAFNKGFEKLKKSGRYDAILEKLPK